MRWPCVLVVALARSRKFLQSALSLLLSFCSILLFCDASHVVILQLDKPFVFLENTHTHTHVYVCVSVVCIFLRVNLHSYFSHCCIFFFKLVLPFFRYCSCCCCLTLVHLILLLWFLLLSRARSCCCYCCCVVHIWLGFYTYIHILFSLLNEKYYGNDMYFIQHTHSRPNHNDTC